MAGTWQRPPDTGCDADGIPHGFRQTMRDMASSLGDEELMRRSSGSIHDPRHTSKSFSDMHSKFFGAAKKAAHLGLANSAFREAGERRVMRGVDAHGNDMEFSGGRYARGAAAAAPSSGRKWDPRPQHRQEEYRETRELRKEGYETRQERDDAVRSQWGLGTDKRNQFQRVMINKQDRHGNSYAPPPQNQGIRDRYGNDADYGGGQYARGAQAAHGGGGPPNGAPGFGGGGGGQFGGGGGGAQFGGGGGAQFDGGGGAQFGGRGGAQFGGGGDALPAPLTPRGARQAPPADQGMLSFANAQAREIPRPADWDARRRRDYAAGRQPMPAGDGPDWHPFHQSQTEVDRKFLQHAWRRSRNP